MPSAMPVGWLQTTIAGPWRGMFSSPATSTCSAIMSASDCMTAAPGIGSSASPILMVRSYCSTRCSSGRTQRDARAAAAQPGRPLLDQLVDDLAHGAPYRDSLTPAVTSAPAAQPLAAAQQPADDLAGVAREAGQRREPLELGPHQRLPAGVEHPPGAEASRPAGRWSAG